MNWKKYTPYAGAVGMLIHGNGKLIIGKQKSSLLSKSFVLKRPSLSICGFNTGYETF